MSAPMVVVREVRFFERPATLRLPFKFGAVTLREAQQVFVRVEIEMEGQRGFGQAAELLAAKWFDKNPNLSNDQNYDQLRLSLRHAAAAYLGAQRPASAFGLHASLQPGHYRACAADGLNGLIASFGTTMLDRAILDALCRLREVSVFAAIAANLPGITALTTPDLYAEDLDAFLATRRQADSIAVRHTVGMADALSEADVTERLNDGLPESLEAVISTYGHRYFKLKVGGDIDADIDRLTRIASVLDTITERYHVSLDGNEQFADPNAVNELIDRIENTPSLSRLWASTLYIEQPISRANALATPVHAIAARKPVALDESDSDIGVYPVGRALGYQGISSKACKGLYRSLLNAARAQAWNRDAGKRRFFIIAEDLTTQPGISVQQDFALASLVGATHVERNAHHYVDGFSGASQDEQQRFAVAHPDLYKIEDGHARLRITYGMASLASLGVNAFAARCEPDWDTMAEMPARGESS